MIDLDPRICLFKFSISDFVFRGQIEIKVRVDGLKGGGLRRKHTRWNTYTSTCKVKRVLTVCDILIDI